MSRIKKEDSFWDNFEYESRGVFADFGSGGDVQERYEMFKKPMKVSVRKETTKNQTESDEEVR